VLRYRYGSLVFQSEAPLPLAADSDPARPADVTVSFGPLPATTAECVREKPHFWMHADGTCILRSPQGVRLLFDNGRALRLEMPAGLDPRLAQSWLVGPGLGLILHQRGLVPLHACAVTLADGAIAIAGDSGAGKSTTARALMHRGHRLLAEDQAIIDPAQRRLYPGVPGVRLAAEVASLFGDRVEERAKVGSGTDKFTIATQQQFDPHPQPLAAVFVLASDPADRPAAERVGPRAAAVVLHRHVYRLRLATFMGGGERIFRWATALARRVPVFILRRPRDLSRLDELATLVEQVTEQAA